VKMKCDNKTVNSKRKVICSAITTQLLFIGSLKIQGKPLFSQSMENVSESAETKQEYDTH
jgi:hypothetical protein